MYKLLKYADFSKGRTWAAYLLVGLLLAGAALGVFFGAPGLFAFMAVLHLSQVVTAIVVALAPMLATYLLGFVNALSRGVYRSLHAKVQPVHGVVDEARLREQKRKAVIEKGVRRSDTVLKACDFAARKAAFEALLAGNNNSQVDPTQVFSSYNSAFVSLIRFICKEVDSVINEGDPIWDQFTLGLGVAQTQSLEGADEKNMHLVCEVVFAVFGSYSQGFLDACQGAGSDRNKLALLLARLSQQAYSLGLTWGRFRQAVLTKVAQDQAQTMQTAAEADAPVEAAPAPVPQLRPPGIEGPDAGSDSDPESLASDPGSIDSAIADVGTPGGKGAVSTGYSMYQPQERGFVQRVFAFNLTGVDWTKAVRQVSSQLEAERDGATSLTVDRVQ